MTILLYMPMVIYKKHPKNLKLTCVNVLYLKKNYCLLLHIQILKVHILSYFLVFFLFCSATHVLSRSIFIKL